MQKWMNEIWLSMSRLMPHWNTELFTWSLHFSAPWWAKRTCSKTAFYSEFGMTKCVCLSIWVHPQHWAHPGNSKSPPGGQGSQLCQPSTMIYNAMHTVCYTSRFHYESARACIKLMCSLCADSSRLRIWPVLQGFILESASASGISRPRTYFMDTS